MSAASLRRALMALAVTGSLLTAPIAATVHELSHLRADKVDLSKKKGEATPACEVCAAYAGLGHALAFALAPAGGAQHDSPAVCAIAPCAEAAGFRLYFERAPPTSSASA